MHHLTLCILFSAHRNLALGKKAIQSSTYEDKEAIFGASRAVDGSKQGRRTTDSTFSCSITNFEFSKTAAQWWAVDLVQMYEITAVSLLPRSDTSDQLGRYLIPKIVCNDSYWMSILNVSGVWVISIGHLFFKRVGGGR